MQLSCLSERRRRGLLVCLVLAGIGPPSTQMLAAGEASEATTRPNDKVQIRARDDRATAAVKDETASEDKPTVPTSVDDQRPSDAQRITRLNRAIESDHKRLAELQAEIERPDSDYQQAEKEFERLDAEFDEHEENFEGLKQGATSEELAEAKRKLDERARELKRAEQRFELEIEERKALQEQIESLQQKITTDQTALDKLRGLPAVKRGMERKEPEHDNAEKLVDNADAPKSETAEAHRADSSDDKTPQAHAGDEAPDNQDTNLMEEEDKVDEELAAAAERAKEKEAEAEEAEDEARSIGDRITILQANVTVTRTLRENSLRKVDNADDTVRSLEEEFRQAIADGLPTGELGPLRARLFVAQERFKAARAESRDHAARLDELQSELSDLQTEQIAVLQQAEAKRREAEAARQVVTDLQNPLALRNVLEWLLGHGPKILTILLSMGIFIWFSRMLENRLVDLMARRGSRGSVEDRENRAKTLVGVFHNAASMLIICGGLLMIFDEVGIPVGPLMGGAAVLGLAVAFGAQSLIKDFFTGFMILLEQQFMVNDVVKIGDISGQVERITLRMTVLRDLEGRVHFIPHGQIGSTTNLTHGWSRAVFDVAVSYSEDADRVMNVLLDIGRGLRRDPEFGPLILEDPVMLGIDSLGESSVQIKFYFKTRPLRQWPVKREMLRRIKNTFDELGIEIPYPHRTVVHRYPGSAGQTPPLDASRDWHQQVA